MDEYFVCVCVCETVFIEYTNLRDGSLVWWFAHTLVFCVCTFLRYDQCVCLQSKLFPSKEMKMQVALTCYIEVYKYWKWNGWVSPSLSCLDFGGLYCLSKLLPDQKQMDASHGNNVTWNWKTLSLMQLTPPLPLYNLSGQSFQQLTKKINVEWLVVSHCGGTLSTAFLIITYL